MEAINYLNEHNVIELLKNQFTIQSLANQATLSKGLRSIISAQTQSLAAIAQRSGINVEHIEAELRDELTTAEQDVDAGLEKYFGNVNKRTGMSRGTFRRLL